MIIDSHHHFWKYDPIDYDWIDDSMKMIQHDFLPEDLKPVLSGVNVDGVITVQARQSVEETDWLIGMADQNKFIKGVVGWLPLAHQNIEALLEKYCQSKILKGVRHVIQGEPDAEFMLRKDFNHGISLLKRYSFVYDLLIVERQLPAAIRFVDEHPEQIFVLDHIAKPLIGSNRLSPWRENIIELARRENVCCKISGMVTEADFKKWTPEQLEPYFKIVIDAFGPGRLFFGSDWPVCLAATTYTAWKDLVYSNIKYLSQSEQAQIMGNNAIAIYRL